VIQFLLFFDTNIPDTTRHQRLFSFPFHSMFAPGEKNQHNIAFLSKAVLLPNQNLKQKHIWSTFSLVWLIAYPIIYLSNVSRENVGPLHEHRNGDTFSIR